MYTNYIILQVLAGYFHRPFLSGTDVMVFKIFSPKNLAKNWRF
jgi:hypothetical protein